MVPEGWKPYGLADIAEIVTGRTPDTSNPAFWDGDMPFITPGDLGAFSWVEDGQRYISREGAAVSRIIPQNSILVTCIGSTIGKMALNGKPCAINQQINAVIPKTGFYPQFLYYALLLRADTLKRMAGNTAVPIVPKRQLGSLTLLAPEIGRQRAIAALLSTWGRAIEQTTWLIEAKRRLKEGLVQQLLTGKRRFPMFVDSVPKTGELPWEWEEVYLKDVSQVLFSSVDKRTYPGQKRVFLCNYLDVYNNDYITSAISFMVSTASDAEIGRFSLRNGDVIITKDSETPDDIAVPSVVIEDVENVVCGYHLAIIRPNPQKVNPIFLAKALKHNYLNRQLSRMANGATRFGLSLAAVENAKIWLPPLEEQNRIANLFFACDQELSLLERMKSLLHTQKVSLMRRLLTGQVRVKLKKEE